MGPSSPYKPPGTTQFGDNNDHNIFESKPPGHEPKEFLQSSITEKLTFPSHQIQVDNHNKISKLEAMLVNLNRGMF